MRRTFFASTIRPLLIVAVAAGIAFGPATLSPARATHLAASSVYLTAYQNDHSTFQRNFNPFLTAARLDFTQGGIYEPLMIITSAGKGNTYHWLATAYKWTNHNKTLLLTIRTGVKWSDGKPFTPADVVFTFNYGKKYSVADETGLMQKGQVTKVSRVGANQVAFTFKTVNTTVLPQLLSNNVMIIPQHIWSKVHNPDSFTNSNPVGTGPFARVTKFSSQEYILGKNPYYWQKGKPTYAGIKVPAISGNDSALAAAVKGDLDWTGNLFSNVQKTYVSKDPAHFHAYYKNIAYPLGLYFNDEKYPFTLYPLREAISLAIDRNKISTIAEAGNEPPSDALGMARVYPAWIDPKLKAQAKALATYNPAKAKQILTSAGFTYKGSSLMDPHGNAVSLDLSCPSGWDDWVTSLQIIQSNLQAIGINASVGTKDQTTWTDQRSKRLLDGGFFWSPIADGGLNAYAYFYNYMSKDSYFPVGQNALSSGLDNLSGWYSDQASTLLAQFRQTASPKKQLSIAYKLEKIQLSTLPFVPTVYAPYWYTYNTMRFTGFPNQNNNYANGSTYVYPDDVKVMTTIRPIK
ncbi:MAG TPA: ABC transporter substrate-binding protein [Chloroflexota bacterium]